MRPAVCSEEERGLILQTAAVNWVYSGIRLTETPYGWRNANHIRLVRKDGKFAWTSQMHYLDLGTDALSAVFPSTSFRREASGGVTKCQLFSQSRISAMTGDQRTYWDNTNKELTSFKIAFFLRFGCPSTSLVLQYGNFVPREPLAVNSLFMGQVSAKICCCKAFDVTCGQPLPSPHKQRWRRFKTEITGITNIPSLSQGLLSSIV